MPIAKETMTTGLIGAVAVAVAIIAPQEMNRAEAEKRISEATCITAVAVDRVIESKEAINEVDTIVKKDTVVEPSGYKYNPLIYTVPEDVFEVTVRQINKDTTLFIGQFLSKETSLLDVNVRLQPSAAPSKVIPIEEPIEEVK